MKKLLSVICVCLVSALVFVGCGIEGATNPTAVRFVREVFYVDKDIETQLDYKVYPSTASNYNVTYTFGADVNQGEYYSLKDGKIRVTSSNFESVKISVQLNDLRDTCEVRLREYPSKVGFFNEPEGDSEPTVKEEDLIYGGLIYALDLKGTFSDGLRGVKNGEFVYKITSSNPSVVSVLDEEKLLVQSTGRRGDATIKVTICNGAGEEVGLSASIRLKVVEPINTVFATLGNLVLRDGQTLRYSLVKGQEAKLEVRYFDDYGFYLKNVRCNCYLSNDKAFEIVRRDGELYLRVIGDVTKEDEYVTTVLSLQSLGVGMDGEPIKFKVTLQVQISE